VVYKALFFDGRVSVELRVVELVPWRNLARLKGLRRRRVRTARVDEFKQIWARSNVLGASFDGQLMAMTRYGVWSCCDEGMEMQVGFAWRRNPRSSLNPNSNPSRTSCEVISSSRTCGIQTK
jgi:hypothetical protein